MIADTKEIADVLAQTREACHADAEGAAAWRVIRSAFADALMLNDNGRDKFYRACDKNR